MSSTDENHNESITEKLAARLIEHGFAKSYIVDDVKGRAVLDWTRRGIILRNNLQKIFDVPKVHPRDVDGEEAMMLVGIFLFDEP